MISQRKISVRVARFFTVTVAIFFVIPAGLADTPPVAAENWLLAKYDTNGDQIISADEISFKRERVFEQMDADADGAVSVNEYQRRDQDRRAALLRARFLKLDLDGNGRLTADEYSSYLGSFDRLDSDGDGRVTPAEMTENTGSMAASATLATGEDVHCLLWFCVRTGF